MQSLLKWEKCEDDGFEWCEICNACKKLSVYPKECNKMYEDCECCLEYAKVKKNFVFECLKCKKNEAI